MYWGDSLVPIHHLPVPGGKCWIESTETFLVYQNIIFEFVVLHDELLTEFASMLPLLVRLSSKQQTYAPGGGRPVHGICFVRHYNWATRTGVLTHIGHPRALIMPRAPKGEAAKRASFMQHAGKFMQLFSMVLGVSSACRTAAFRTSPTPSPGSGGHNIKGDKAPYQQRMQPSAFWQTEWGKLLRNPAVNQPGSRVHKEFISEFRVPFSIFEDIVKDCTDQEWTRSSTGRGKKKRGRPSLPLESKILGCLYRLGSGCLPRTQGRLFGSSHTVADQFFLDFCAFYAQKYGEECVVPATEAERRDVEEVYAKMGFPGCLGKRYLHCRGTCYPLQ